MAADNVKLGEFNLDGIPPAPRGVPQIEVTFNIDVNGILNVSAKDKGTGKSQHITIQSSRLTEAEIERMKRDAEVNEGTDRQRKEAAEIRNEADSLAYNAEKTLRDLGDKVEATEKARVEQEIADLREVSAKDDAARTRQAIDTLTKSLHALSQKLYASQEQPAGSGAAPGPDETAGSSGAGETVDAEFSDKEA